jgi:predicted DsbA family dithiol-disulfide isomerase
MQVEIHKILNGVGEKISGTKIVAAYRHLIRGDEEKAGAALARLYYDAYWTGVRNVTTDDIVKKIYQELGQEKPENSTDSDPDIVREAVNMRVAGEIKTAKDILANGMRKSPVVIPDGDHYRLYDGFNRVVLMMARGDKIIEVMEKQ